MKKLVLLALGVAMIGMVNCSDDEGYRSTLVADVIITTQPFGGLDVDFLACQFQVTTDVFLQGNEPGYEPVTVDVKWMQNPDVVLKDTTYSYDSYGTFTDATFLYAKSGTYFIGKYFVKIAATSKAVTSDTVLCTTIPK